MIFTINKLVSATSGFTFPKLTTLCTNHMQHREVALLMGVTTALGSLKPNAGPLWSGAVFVHVMPGPRFRIGAIIFAIASFLLMPRLVGAPLSLAGDEKRSRLNRSTDVNNEITTPVTITGVVD